MDQMNAYINGWSPETENIMNDDGPGRRPINDSPVFDTGRLAEAVGLWHSNRNDAEVLYGPISDWSTWQVTSINKLFYYSKDFNEDLFDWDVSSVTSMYLTFAGATSYAINRNPVLYSASSFNSDISAWDTSSVESMSGTFSHAKSFNVDLSEWDVSRVRTFYAMFIQTSNFTHTLSWCLGESVDTEYMFLGSRGSLSERCSAPFPTMPERPQRPQRPQITAAPSTILTAYRNETAYQNGTIYQNDTAALYQNDTAVLSSGDPTSLEFLFANETTFDADVLEEISGWITSSVTSMEETFSFSSFAGDVSRWEVGNVVSMRRMFWRAILFNGDLSDWDTSQVATMAQMFTGAWTCMFIHTLYI